MRYNLISTVASACHPTYSQLLAAVEPSGTPQPFVLVCGGQASHRLSFSITYLVDVFWKFV